MYPLLNSPYIKERGLIGPFSLTEAFFTFLLSVLVYILAVLCEDELGHDRLWSWAWSCIPGILALLFKCLVKKNNPTWLSSRLSYHFLQPRSDRFQVHFRKYPFLTPKASSMILLVVLMYTNHQIN